MTTRIGLALFDKTGIKCLEICPADMRIYAYHPSHGDDVAALTSPVRPGVVVLQGTPFDWLLETLQHKVGDGFLELIRLPARKNVDAEMEQVRAAGLIGPNTRITKGNS